ncbi:MAG: hypothetical protein NC088_01155 [Bacteroides sp.]|nr:hypothetical protein [Bacteroides sp.]
MLQLIAVIACSLALFTNLLQKILFQNNIVINKVGQVLLCICIIFFLLSWLYLSKTFYTIYGSLYHLRKKRFLKYTKVFGWFYEKFFHKTFYEKNYRKRDILKIDSFLNFDNQELQKIKEGGTILILYKDNTDYSKIAADYIVETVDDGETVDYVMTYKSPVELCKSFTDRQMLNIVKHLSIIDCFTSHYGFDDKVVKFAKEEYAQKGYKFYDADSFAEIHTAANSSWYRFRKVCQAEENQFRIPHRTIYDTLSSLIRFSSEELYFLFLRHVISSEKSHGMISVILEPHSLKDDLKNDLIRMADIVLEFDGFGMREIK